MEETQTGQASEDKELLPSYAELLHATDGGRSIFEHVLSQHGLKMTDAGASHLRNPFYDDDNGGMSITQGDDRYIFKDFGDHDYRGDAFDFAGHHYQLDPKKQYKELAQRIVDEVLNGQYVTSGTAQRKQPKRERQTVFFDWQDIGDGWTLLHDHIGGAWENGKDQLARYKVDKAPDGRTRYWYIDRDQNIRECKLVQFYPYGANISKKGAMNSVSITVRRPKGQPSDRCLFGEHLIPERTDKPVIIVEAEDAAITAACKYDTAHWCASGGKAIKDEQLERIKDCEIFVMPDHDILLDEKERRHLSDHLQRLAQLGYNIKRLDMMRTNAADVADILHPDKLAKMDIRDYLEALYNRALIAPF